MRTELVLRQLVELAGAIVAFAELLGHAATYLLHRLISSPLFSARRVSDPF